MYSGTAFETVAQTGVGKYMSNSSSAFDLQTRHSRSAFWRESGGLGGSKWLNPQRKENIGFPPKCTAGMTEWSWVQYLVRSMDM